MSENKIESNQLALPETKPITEMRPLSSAIPNLPLLSEEAVALAEKSAERASRIVLASVKFTSTDDWSNYDGDPYLRDQGTDKLAALWGVSVECDGIYEDRRTDENGTYIVYTCRGAASYNGRRVEVVGTASTRSPFYSRKKGEDVPLEDIDLTRVKKHAYSNMHQHAVKRTIGLRGITWLDLERVFGPDAVKKIKDRSVGHSGADRSKEDTGDTSELRARIRRALLLMSGCDPETAIKLLKEYTSFKGKDGTTVPGKTRVEQLSPKAVPVTWGKIERDLKQQQEQAGPEEWTALEAKVDDYLAQVS